MKDQGVVERDRIEHGGALPLGVGVVIVTAVGAPQVFVPAEQLSGGGEIAGFPGQVRRAQQRVDRLPAPPVDHLAGGAEDAAVKFGHAGQIRLIPQQPAAPLQQQGFRFFPDRMRVSLHRRPLRRTVWVYYTITEKITQVGNEKKRELSV